MLSAAQLLDELMGRDRNLAPDEKRCNVRWDHDSVCKYYLCEFCPAELFTNTRSDLGPCEKIHDENLRKQYEKSTRHSKVGYERDFLRYLQSLLAEVERRIRRGHARLALSQNQQAAGGVSAVGPTGKNEEKIQVLTDKIEGLLVQIEELGTEGKVEEAQGMMKLVEQLKEERELLKSTTSTIESFAAQEKQMEVCEVCGAFLIVGDAQSRVDDHLMGKQHMGYAKIKNTVEELKEKLRKKTEEPEREEREKKEREEKEREKEKEREREEKEKKRRREEEEKEKERNREREKRKRSRSRSRNSSRTDRRGSKSRDHKRSRSRDKRRTRDRQRSRSHNRAERKPRSRSRDKRRSKSRDRRSYKHKSKSRERDRERKSKEKEKRNSDDKKSRKSSSREKQSESRKTEPKELSAQIEINGANEGNKSEGDTQSN
ncbi:luc7-like protein 3 isoform X3 [Ascaphus truei]|uniref:luc7-like protein 3 isoform X3 n=1 Tax=Ascaphus truei TaxID=8439 RepID=UPI003F596599